jgi:deoxyribodipyrimidine photo-lyase
MTSRPKVLIYLLRRDLRLSDNPVYHEIWRIHSSDSSGRFTHLLPLYVFPAQQIDVSGFLRPPSGADSPLKSPYPEPRSQQGGYRRCGPHRAKFLAESVWDLKESLDKAGSGLCIRAGRLAEVIKSVLDFFEQDESTSKAKERVQSVAEAPKENPSPESRQRGEVVGVWMCSEEGTEERSDEKAVQSVVEERGKEFRLFEDEKYLIDE